MAEKLKGLSDRHREIIRRLVSGQSPTSVARSLGVCKETVAAARYSAQGHAYAQQLHKELDKAVVKQGLLTALQRAGVK